MCLLILDLGILGFGDFSFFFSSFVVCVFLLFGFLGVGISVCLGFCDVGMFGYLEFGVFRIGIYLFGICFFGCV